jgi:hypothetical protein
LALYRQFVADAITDRSGKLLSASLQEAEAFWPLRKSCQRKGIAASVEAQIALGPIHRASHRTPPSLPLVTALAIFGA